MRGFLSLLIILRVLFQLALIVSPQACGNWLQTWGPFLEGPEKFARLESRSKISNLMSSYDYRAVLFTYSYMNRSSLHTRSFRRIHHSVFRYRLTKNGFAGLKSNRGFRETIPCARARETRASVSTRHWTFGTSNSNDVSNYSSVTLRGYLTTVIKPRLAHNLRLPGGAVGVGWVTTSGCVVAGEGNVYKKLRKERRRKSA